MATIASVTVRMYQVGFGDCFLLTFGYAAPFEDGSSRRHILVDFGSTHFPASVRKLSTIAKLINSHSDGGRIDVVVVSHRHRDHLSAFGSKEAVGALMAKGYPRLVVRPWTEDPALDASATGVPGADRAAAAAVGADGDGAIGKGSRGLLRDLHAAAQFAESLGNRLGAPHGRSLGARVSAAAAEVANADAVNQLNAWSNGGRGRYLHYGLPSGIEDVVPGLGVWVLGPPTADQHKAVRSQRADDPDEFWMIYNGLVAKLPPAALAGAPAEEPSTVPEPARTAASFGVDFTGRLTAAADAPNTGARRGDPGPTRWLTDRMRGQNLQFLMRLVRILDTVLNNTSLILVFEVPTPEGPLRLLFGGDAQIENWEYALKYAPDRKATRAALGDVALYKVGHHGSRNASPRSLVNLWRRTPGSHRQLVALMSTKPGVHGESEATAVPRRTLVAALDTLTEEQLYSTEGLTSETPWVEATADTAVGRAITVTDGSRKSEPPTDG
jgi:hypothetical protein